MFDYVLSGELTSDPLFDLIQLKPAWTAYVKCTFAAAEPTAISPTFGSLKFMVSIDLDTQEVLLTGALSATAPAIIERCLQAGAFPILTDRISEAEAKQRLVTMGLAEHRFTYMCADLTIEDEVNQLVGRAFDAHPRISTILGHAGGCTLHPFSTTDAKEFGNVLDLNFVSQTRLTRAVLRQWVRSSCQGHFIYTSSYVAKAPHSRISAYVAAKAALEAFARCMALEYASERIRFNCISPGNIATGSSLLVYESDAEYRQFVDRVSPWGERNSASGVADAFIFLMSPLANEMNGAVLNVDMGVGIPKIG